MTDMKVYDEKEPCPKCGETNFMLVFREKGDHYGYSDCSSERAILLNMQLIDGINHLKREVMVQTCLECHRVRVRLPQDYKPEPKE